MERICIYGLGAIGGLLAARLAASGRTVSAIARGATPNLDTLFGLARLRASQLGLYSSF
jgi:prephenate dehydrogenase